MILGNEFCGNVGTLKKSGIKPNRDCNDTSFWSSFELKLGSVPEIFLAQQIIVCSELHTAPKSVFLEHLYLNWQIPVIPFSFVHSSPISEN